MSSKWTLVLIIASVIGLHVHKAYTTGDNNRGNFSVEDFKTKWATQYRDSIKTQSFNDVFTPDAMPGSFKVMVHAKVPAQRDGLKTIDLRSGKTFKGQKIKDSQ